MRSFLENIKTLIIEFIGLIGGFIWARQTNWDYEPIILMCVSAVGIIIFFVLRLIPTHEDRPILDLEFISKGSTRSPPTLISNMSPKDETGQYYLIEVGGTYLFEVTRNYDLIIRNNSKNNAYNIVLYKLKNSYHLEFKNKFNSLEPLTIDNPKKVEFTYKANRAMTHSEAEKILKDKVPDDLKNFILVASYQSESRKTYYTKFSPLDINEQLIKPINFDDFEKI